MYFEINDDQIEFKRSVKKTLDKNGGLNISKSYRLGVQKCFKETMKDLNELGFSTIMIPETYDGAELSDIEMMVAYEEFGKKLLPLVYEETYSFAVPLLIKYGNEKQKELLHKIANGEIKISLAIMEEQGKSFEELAINTTLQSVSDGYLLNATKTFVLDDGSADYYITLVNIDDKKTLLMVPNGSNIEVSRLNLYEEITTASIVKFNAVPITNEHIIGVVGKGWDYYEEAKLHLMAAVSAHSVGVMEKIIDISVDYANTREQFGSPIGRFQAIKHRLVDMKIDLELARTLSYYANWALAADDTEKVKAVYQAKAFISEKASEITSASILIHGAIGVTNEADCHLFLKRAKFLESYLGSPNYYYEQLTNHLNWRNAYDYKSKVVQS